MRRNPDITAFHVRPSGADYSSLLESLSTHLPSDHARIHSQHMAANPVDAEPPITLRFASTKPRPATFTKERWYKETAKTKLFLFDPRQSGEETLPFYCSRQWGSHSAAPTRGRVRDKERAGGDGEGKQPAGRIGTRHGESGAVNGVFLRSMRWRRRTQRHWRSPRSTRSASSTTTAQFLTELRTRRTARWCGRSWRTCPSLQMGRNTSNCGTCCP